MTNYIVATRPRNPQHARQPPSAITSRIRAPSRASSAQIRVGAGSSVDQGIVISSDEDEVQEVTPVPTTGKRSRPGSERNVSERPTKQRGSTSTPLPVMPTPPPVRRKPKEPTPQPNPEPLFDPDPEDEDEISMPMDVDPAPVQEPEVTSESEDEGILAAADIHDEELFEPFVPRKVIKSDHSPTKTFEYNPPKRSNKRPITTTIPTSSVDYSCRGWRGESTPPWELARLCGMVRKLKVEHEVPYSTKPRKSTFARRERKIILDKSAGAINRLAQKEGLVAVVTSTSGGHADADHDESVDRYNKAGGSFVWDESGVHLLRSHSKYLQSRSHSGDKKNYTVNDVKFDPLHPIVVTSGNDKKINIMGCSLGHYPADHSDDEDDNEEMESGRQTFTSDYTFDAVPFDLAFQPGRHEQSSIVAVAAKQIYLQKYICEDVFDVKDEGRRGTIYAVERKDQKQSAGAFAWGVGSSSDKIFVSTEPEDDDVGQGYHRCFDVETQKRTIQFDAEEAGDALALNATGQMLALSTRANSENIAPTWDSSKAIKKVVLVPSKTERLEINTAVFSPDGLYLALARNDNRTHVYDSRRLDKILYDFEHLGESRTSPGCRSFGVTHVEWTQSSRNRLGLVTGGNDGCVRLWYLPGDKENGIILGEAEADIGYFSLGNRYMREHDLVIGDCDGKTYILDGLGDF